MRRMSVIARIRKDVFRCDQAPFARIAGVSQGTVSRWEQGRSEPTRQQLARIRDEALTRGLLWSDSWFFDRPVHTGPSHDAEARP